MPIEDLSYPLGIADYEELTGRSFDMKSYQQIKFRYYVGSLEDTRKTSERFDENGNLAPMHDMSYFDRSVPKEEGRTHNNFNGHGVNELRDLFIKETYRKTLGQKQL